MIDRFEILEAEIERHYKHLAFGGEGITPEGRGYLVGMGDLLRFIDKKELMSKNGIDWKEFAEALLWNNVVTKKNEYSGYCIMLEDGPEGKGIHTGDIGKWAICSYLTPGSYKALTWKELSLALGLWTEHLTSDGHDCSVCPERNSCKAFFKDNKDHERCNWWTENMKKEQ